MQGSQEKKNSNDIRNRVLDALTLIRGSDVLVSAKPDLPPERLAYELCRMWMDTIWLPSRRYIDGLKGDWKAEDEMDFEDAFSAEEYSWIERFHRFLELRLDRLSPEDRKAERFPDGDTWRGIVRDAGNLLALMEPDNESRTRRERLLGNGVPAWWLKE